MSIIILRQFLGRAIGFRAPYASFALGVSLLVNAQTSSTGAVTGVVLDASGSAVPGATVRLEAKESRNLTLISDSKGWFRFASVAPGSYELEGTKSDFEKFTLHDVRVHVTETLHLEIHLQLATIRERTQVSSSALMVQTDTSSLGKTVNDEAIHHLPLVARNFAQIAGLSAGVITGVFNAGELGSGGIALSQIGPSNDGIFVHGARSYDNNWMLDGISVSDVLGTGSASGGIPVPNPDAIEEFEVQTGLYNAVFGRSAGANISIVTKDGGDEYHGSVFEFFRNSALNANDYFRNETGQTRPVLMQNQFGSAIGGPIRKNHLQFFASYQGTRQINGIAAGQSRLSCAASLSEPPLTNDRSATALGALFAGMSGALGGTSVRPDGSNINPVALALLNLKLPNGNFLVPTPQKVDPTKPFASQGLSVLSEPCRFSEDQFLTNLDYVPGQTDQLALRFFISNTDQVVTFPGNGFNSLGNIPGFRSPGEGQFAVVSFTETHVPSSAVMNQAKVAFVRTVSGTGATAPFAWSDVGVSEGRMNDENELPELQILGSLSMASAFPRTYVQNTFFINDVFTALKGSHAWQFGGSIARLQDPLHYRGFGSFLQFLSWPDFLLGLSSTGNGSGTFSNVFESADAYGLFDREFRAWEASAFAQDNYRVSRRLMLNLGVRYEHPGQFADELGRNASFDSSRANTDPPPAGSLDGVIVARNFPGPLPAGVTRVDNSFGTYAVGQNTFAPRAGFAWQVLPKTTRLVLRGGYGLYYSRPTGQAFTASVLAAPFGLTRISTGTSNSGATFQSPFAQPFPTPSSFPMFVPYSSTSQASINALSPNFRPALIQQYSTGIQAELHKNLLLEIGYVGTRGTHLQRFRSLNQALDASPQHPVRGATSNTLANIALRVPIPGIRADSLREIESAGSSWYNGLEAGLAKRLSYGIQFLASYTFSKVLDTDGANINGTSAANTLTLGDQNSASQRWGRASFDRTHRFIVSATWFIRNSKSGISRGLLRGWSISTIATIQSGSALTVGNTNSNNVFGISEDRAELSGTCSNHQLVTSGPVERKLNNYFDHTCFAPPTIIGADGIGTGFGDSATGIVDGPGQINLDFSISKAIHVHWPHDKEDLILRAELYNALNHPQFSNPDTNYSSSTFGVISATSVNPRVAQLAVKFAF